MNRVLPYIVTFALGLWAGGLVALILFVSTLFTQARALAVDAAPVLFAAFEKYQLVLAAIALLSLVLWRWCGRTLTKTFAVAAATLATILAVVQISYISPTINRSRLVDRPTFDRYHRIASTNYSTIGGLVMISLALSIAAGRRESGSLSRVSTGEG